jgi:hypothetical protein
MSIFPQLFIFNLVLTKHQHTIIGFLTYYKGIICFSDPGNLFFIEMKMLSPITSIHKSPVTYTYE